MSLRNYTARDLGIYGPHLIAHTIDGNLLIVDEILDYRVDWCDVTLGVKHWGAVFTYRAPGVDEPIMARVPVRRLRVAGLHCQACPFMGCHDCEYQGGTEPGEVVPQPDSGGVEGSAQRANGAVACDNGCTPRETPASALTLPGRGRTSKEFDTMSVPTHLAPRKGYPRIGSVR